MIPQCSWRCDGMRARAPADAASECYRDKVGKRCSKLSTKALRPGHPAHVTSMRPIRKPKNRNTPEIATFLRLRITAGRQNADRGPKKRQIGRTVIHFRLAEGRKESAIAKKLHRSRNFCFYETDRRNEAYFCERRTHPQCRSGRAAARNPEASTPQALVPSPLAKIPR